MAAPDPVFCCGALTTRSLRPIAYQQGPLPPVPQNFGTSTLLGSDTCKHRDGHLVSLDAFSYDATLTIKGIKRKRPFEHYRWLSALQTLPSITFSTVSALSGREYVMSSTVLAGGFGKMHFGSGAYGIPAALKEIRNSPKEGLSRSGRPKTLVVSRDEAYGEAQAFASVRQFINEGMIYWDSLPEQSLGSMKKVRSAPLSCGILDIIEDHTPNAEKTYIAMNLLPGNLLELWRCVPNRLKPPLARSAGYQVSMELDIMHSCNGLVHSDLKLGNMLWQGAGAIGVIDVGMSWYEADAAIRPQCGPKGSYYAPEMCQVSTDQPYGVPLTRAIDIYALGLMMAELSHSARKVGQVINPFVHDFAFPKMHCNGITCQAELFEAFELWKASMRGPNGRVLPSAVRVAPCNLFSNFFRDLATFDPSLFDLVMNDALEADPAARISASGFNARLSVLMQQWCDEPQLKQLKLFMATLAPRTYAHKVAAAASCYARWEQLGAIPYWEPMKIPAHVLS